MPIPDTMPLNIAIDRGYFAREGLKVEIEEIQGGSYALPRLLGGGLNFSLLNYVAVVAAEATTPGSFKIVSDSYQAAPNAFQLMVRRESTLQNLGEARNKLVATATSASVGTLTSEMALKVYGLTKHDVRWTTMPLRDMPQALAAGRIDVAWLTEPFISMVDELGGRMLYDIGKGPAEGFPIAGWGTTANYATKNPRIVAAFQRAMAAGQAAAVDRNAVTEALSDHTHIEPDLSRTITLGTFPQSLHAPRLQRVPDAMLEYGLLKKPFHIQSMLLPPTPTPTSASPAATSPGTGR